MTASLSQGVVRCLHLAAPETGPTLKVLTAALAANVPEKAFMRPKSFDNLHPSSLHKYGAGRHGDVNSSDRAWKLQQDGWHGADPERVAELLKLGAAYKHVLNNAKVAVLKRLTWDDKDEEIEEGCYLRVFVTPRRYWQRLVDKDLRLVEQNFVVINKPRNIPSVSRVDNLYENVQSLAEGMLEPSQLWPVQRLDEPTQGLILFARNLEFCKVFNGLIQQKGEGVEKCYSFIAEASFASRKTSATFESYTEINEVQENSTSAPAAPASTETATPVDQSQEIAPPLPAPGTVLTHYMDLRSGGSKSVADTCTTGGCDKEASLVVLDHQPVPGHPSRRFVRIQLLTGRTHQIRAQFAHIGWPLAGDCMYHADLPAPADLDFLLKCYRLAFEYDGRRIAVDLEPTFTDKEIIDIPPPPPAKAKPEQYQHDPSPVPQPSESSE